MELQTLSIKIPTTIRNKVTFIYETQYMNKTQFIWNLYHKFNWKTKRCRVPYRTLHNLFLIVTNHVCSMYPYLVNLSYLHYTLGSNNTTI